MDPWLLAAESGWFDELTGQTVQLAGLFGLLVLAAVRILLDTRRSSDVDARADIIEARSDALLEKTERERDAAVARADALLERVIELERVNASLQAQLSVTTSEFPAHEGGE